MSDRRKFYASTMCIILVSVYLFSSALAFRLNKATLEISPDLMYEQDKNVILNLLETVYGGNNEEMLQGFYNTDVSSIFC